MPIFSGNATDYFDWKCLVQEILACTKTLATANLVAVKYTCFNDPHIKNAVRTVQSLTEMFKIPDARFGSKTAHATWILKEISALKSIAYIISFVEQFENARRQAENSNISVEDISVELKMQNMQNFLSEIKDRAIQAKFFRNPDNLKAQSPTVKVYGETSGVMNVT